MNQGGAIETYVHHLTVVADARRPVRRAELRLVVKHASASAPLF